MNPQHSYYQPARWLGVCLLGAFLTLVVACLWGAWKLGAM